MNGKRVPLADNQRRPSASRPLPIASGPGVNPEAALATISGYRCAATGPISRLVASLAVVLLLVGCSGPSFSVAVQDVEIPAGSSGGRICYVEGTESSPVRFGSATYTAEGTYTSNNPFNDSVTIRVYGRTEAPATASGCVSASASDIRLSEEFVLRKGEPAPVVVGGSEYGGKLAEVISHADYWLGAEISGNYTLLDGERIRLENGRIRVTAW